MAMRKLKLKRILPSIIVVVLVFSLYGLQYEETLTKEEAETIDAFSERKQVEDSYLNTLENIFASDRFQEETNEILNSFERRESIDVTVFASDIGGEDIQSWPSLLEEGLQDFYGDYRFRVEVLPVNGLPYANSLQFVEDEGWTVINDTNPDIVIFEPFLQSDYGVLTMDHSMTLTKTVIEELDGYPILKIPEYGFDEGFVAEWEAFAQGETVSYVKPIDAVESAETEFVAETALTEAGQEIIGRSFVRYFTEV